MVDFVAVYAAVVATAVAFWDVFKWWRSERFRLSGYTNSNMKTFGAGLALDEDDKKYVMLWVENRGAMTCEVLGVYLQGYDTLWGYLRNKPSFAAFVNHTGTFGPPVPYRLEPGGQFKSGVVQTEELVERSRNQKLYMGIAHTMSSKMFLRRINPIKNVENQPL